MADPSPIEGEVRSAGGIRLRTQVYAAGSEPPRAQLLFLHGYDDYAARYSEALTYLAGAGFHVATFDFRGHGRSGGKPGYCAAWEEYLADVDAVIAGDMDLAGSRFFLMGQSHGALVAGHWALRHPERLLGVVMTSAYFRLIMPVSAGKLAAARALSRLAPALKLKSEIAVEMLTRDPDRQAADRADDVLHRVATPRWYCTHLAAQAELLRRAPEFDLPLLMLHGDADPIADPAAARQFFDRAGTADKTWRAVPGARHEALRDTGKGKVWETIRQWLEARSGPPRLQKESGV